MKSPTLALAAFLLAALPTAASAASVSLARSSREVTPEEIAGGAPIGGYVHDFFLTSDSDLLTFSQIAVDVPLFQHLLGSDSAALHSLYAGDAPALAADSYITTPGSTMVLGGGFGVGGDRLWGDLSNDGPQQGFHFARLTTGQTGSFAGRVGVRGGDGPVYLPFNFALPGNAADMSLLAGEPTYSLDYSLDPTPPPVIPPTPPVVPPTPPVTPPVPPVTPPAPPVDPPANPNPPSNVELAKLSLTRQSRLVTHEEVAGGAPAGGYVHEFYVNTATDILSVNSVNVDVPLFQDVLGSDKSRPGDGLEVASASITADSFIDTPGDTLTLGSGWTGDDGLWGDLSNDGAQEDFLFARLTVAETGTFAGRIDVRHDEMFVSLPFEFLLPGSEADMALLAGEPTYAKEFPPTPPPQPTVPPPPVTPPVQTPPSDPPPVDPPVYTPPVETPPVGEPYTPPTEPVNPPIVIYPPGYPIIDPPTDFPIDPTDPALPPDASPPPSDGGDNTGLPPAVQPGEPTPQNPDGTIELPTIIEDGQFILRPGIIVLPYFPTEIDVTLPVDGEQFTFTHYWRLNRVSLENIATEFTMIDLATNFDGGLVAFDGSVARSTVLLYSSATGQTALMLDGGSVIPEPTTGILALAAATALLAAHRRGRRP